MKNNRQADDKQKNKGVVSILLFTLLIFSPVKAGEVSMPFTFKAGTPAVADQVNDNFNSVKNEVDDNHARIAALETALATLQQTVSDQATTISNLTATNIAYSNSNAGFASTNVQNAIDEMYISLHLRVEALENKLIRVNTSTIDGYPAIVIRGANLHLQNNEQSTRTVNGTGNLIVGYNERRGEGNDARDGSHNIIIGEKNNYSSYSGLVAGYNNTISNSYATVSGGRYNTASGGYATVSGGQINVASGNSSSVSGGTNNTVTGMYSSISGGNRNAVAGNYSSISGGSFSDASGDYASVSGGIRNHAVGNYSSVSAGNQNTANGQYSSINGGSNNIIGDFGKLGSIAGGSGNEILDGADNCFITGGSNFVCNTDYDVVTPYH